MPTDEDEETRIKYVRSVRALVPDLDDRVAKLKADHPNDPWIDDWIRFFTEGTD